MAPGSLLGLAIMAGVCLAGVVAQQYWTYVDEDSPLYDQLTQNVQEPSSLELQPNQGPVYLYNDQDVVAPYGAVRYWDDRGRDGWGGGGKGKKKKGKKKKGKKGKKGGDDHGGWGPLSISTSGVKVGWKGWIPPIKGWGWGWFGEKSGHYSFTDPGPGWGKRPRPHFPDPGPPVIIKHHPVHHKVQHHGWGWGGGGGGGGGGGY